MMRWVIVLGDPVWKHRSRDRRCSVSVRNILIRHRRKCRRWVTDLVANMRMATRVVFGGILSERCSESLLEAFRLTLHDWSNEAQNPRNTNVIFRRRLHSALHARRGNPHRAEKWLVARVTGIGKKRAAPLESYRHNAVSGLSPILAGTGFRRPRPALPTV